MFKSTIISSIVILSILLQIVLSAPSLRVRRADDKDADNISSDLNPVNLEEINGDGLDREKRKLPEEAFGAKNAVIGFVFGASQSSSGKGKQNPKKETIPVDVPEFDRKKVSLDVPDELFASSFTQVTNVSKVIGDLITNSARRFAKIVEIFQPIIGKNLIIKGQNPPPPQPIVDDDVDDDDNDV